MTKGMQNFLDWFISKNYNIQSFRYIDIQFNDLLDQEKIGYYMEYLDETSFIWILNKDHHKCDSTEERIKYLESLIDRTGE